jgi:hypothetical protein
MPFSAKEFSVSFSGPFEALPILKGYIKGSQSHEGADSVNIINCSTPLLKARRVIVSPKRLWKSIQHRLGNLTVDSPVFSTNIRHGNFGSYPILKMELSNSPVMT